MIKKGYFNTIFFIVLISAQLTAIVFLYKYIKFHMNTLGVSIHSIDKDTVVQKPSTHIEHYYEPKPNKTYGNDKKWVDYKYTYTINQDGLNERFNYPVEKESGTFRIITLGDSFTFGELVDTEDNWTEILEKILNSNILCNKKLKYEVINLGVGGYDTAFEVERYSRKGPKYNPDLVIMLIVDFMRVTDYRLAHKKIYTEAERAQLLKVGIYHPGTRIDKELDDAYRIAYQSPHYDRFFTLYSGDLLIVDHQKNRQGTLFFNSLKEKYKQISYSQTSFQIGEEKTSLPDKHPNKAGHKAIARDVFDYLVASDLLPCK